MDLLEIDAGIARVFEVGDRFTADDDQLHVRFFKGATQDNTDEAIAARKVSGKKQTYKLCDFVEIQTRGSKDIVRRQVWFDEYENNPIADNVRFKKQYEDFKAGRETKTSGTMLVSCGFISPDLAAELAHEKIFTVEHLSRIDDAIAQRYMGGLTLKKRAQAFLQLQSGSELKLPEELAKRDAKIEELGAALAKVQAAQKSKG